MGHEQHNVPTSTLGTAALRTPRTRARSTAPPRSLRRRVDAAGNVTVAGPSEGGGVDWAVVSWSPTGAKRWTWRYDDSAHGFNMPLGLLAAADGSVYVTGYSVEGGTTQSLTLRLSATGALRWKKLYAGPEGTQAITVGIAARPGGGVLV